VTSTEQPYGHRPTSPLPPVPPPPAPSPKGPSADGGRAPRPPGAPSGPVPAPRLDGRERQLDHRIVTVWRVFGSLGVLVPVLVGVTLGFVVLDALGWVVLLAALALMGVVVGWLPGARYRRWRWQLTDLALELRSGVLVHRQESVPYFRIQQIDIAQGPVDRLLDLATLQVTTASASGSAALPGIHEADAPTIRAELLARAALALADHPSEIRDAV
jgi:uncharacterized protein